MPPSRARPRRARLALACLAGLAAAVPARVLRAQDDVAPVPTVHGTTADGHGIPEPLNFDLVRPLGARRGELEVNTLGVVTLRRPGIHWAPEVEYAFLDGHAVELEAPFANQHLEAVKLALQGTLPVPGPHPFVHGWQLIGAYGREGTAARGTALYLAGAHLGRRLSLFVMAGVQVEREFARAQTRLWPQINPSLFVALRASLSAGLEINCACLPGELGALVLLPQLQAQVRRWLKLQAGVGALYAATGLQPIFAARVILEP